MEILSKDFVEFIECCVRRDVKFLIAIRHSTLDLESVSQQRSKLTS